MSIGKFVYPPEILEQLREQGRKTGAAGGRAAAQNMTKKQRKARSQKALAAREAKRKGEA
jgi:hypothetical protein